MARQYFSERKLAILCLAFVIPRQVEECLVELVTRPLFEQLEMSGLRST